MSMLLGFELQRESINAYLKMVCRWPGVHQPHAGREFPGPREGLPPRAVTSGVHCRPLDRASFQRLLHLDSLRVRAILGDEWKLVHEVTKKICELTGVLPAHVPGLMMGLDPRTGTPRSQHQVAAIDSGLDLVAQHTAEHNFQEAARVAARLSAEHGVGVNELTAYLRAVQGPPPPPQASAGPRKLGRLRDGSLILFWQPSWDTDLLLAGSMGARSEVPDPAPLRARPNHVFFPSQGDMGLFSTRVVDGRWGCGVRAKDYFLVKLLRIWWLTKASDFAEDAWPHHSLEPDFDRLVAGSLLIMVAKTQHFLYAERSRPASSSSSPVPRDKKKHGSKGSKKKGSSRTSR